jgi:glucosyl-dolichyl phosphate glucuronosyltransferase
MNRVTIILCTYNRSEELSGALRSIAQSEVSAAVEWDVLVVDNNSTDQTREVVQEFCREFPGRFKYLFELRQGKTYALNAAVRAASGDILVFTDDDVVVEPNWLQSMTTAIDRYGCAGVGGRILPKWNQPPPTWLPLEDQNLLAALVSFDLGTEAKPLLVPPFGANMGFRKRVFEQYGGFRTDLGPCRRRGKLNDDTEFGRRVLNGGETIIYEPAATVRHLVPQNRLKKQYFLEWSYAKGRSDVRETAVSENPRPLWSRVPARYLRRLLRWTLHWMVSINPATRFHYKCVVWGLAGQIVEHYHNASVPATQEAA